MNGFDMAGWRWASELKVGDDLFAPFTSYEGGRDDVGEPGDTLTQWLEDTGFRSISDGINFKLVSGWTSTDVFSRVSAVASAFYNQTVPETQYRTFPEVTDSQTNTRGGWFYREASVSVPEPSTFAILGLGLAALGWRRRGRADDVNRTVAV